MHCAGSWLVKPPKYSKESFDWRCGGVRYYSFGLWIWKYHYTPIKYNIRYRDSRPNSQLPSESQCQWYSTVAEKGHSSSSEYRPGADPGQQYPQGRWGRGVEQWGAAYIVVGYLIFEIFNVLRVRCILVLYSSFVVSRYFNFLVGQIMKRYHVWKNNSDIVGEIFR